MTPLLDKIGHAWGRWKTPVKAFIFWAFLGLALGVSAWDRSIWGREILPWQFFSAGLGFAALSALFAARVSLETGRVSLFRRLVLAAVGFVVTGYTVYEIGFPPLTWAWLLLSFSLSWLFLGMATPYVEREGGQNKGLYELRSEWSAWDVLEKVGLPPLHGKWKVFLTEYQGDLAERLAAWSLAKRAKRREES